MALAADGVGRVATLLLGPRPDGSFYGKDERETLAAIADPMARGLAIALERARHDMARDIRERALGERVEALCRFVREKFGVEIGAPPVRAVAGGRG